MSDNRTSTTSLIGVGILGLVVGLIIGLPILGWVLWPVQWTNGTMEILPPAAQQDFLRAAIDSYSVNTDANLATQRYYSLGRFKETTLSAVSTDPGTQTPEEIEAFAAAVGAQDVLVNPPPPMIPASARATLAMWISLCCGLLLVIALIVAILVFWFRSRKPKSSAEGPSAIEPIPASTPEADAPTPEAEELETAEIPDWLQEEPSQEFSEAAPTVRTGAAVALGAAGAVAAAHAFDSDQPEDVEQPTEAPATVPAVALGAAGAAAAASIVDADQPEETEQPTEAPGITPAVALGAAGVVAAASIFGSDQPEEAEQTAEAPVEAPVEAAEEDLSWLEAAAPAATVAAGVTAAALVSDSRDEPPVAEEPAIASTETAEEDLSWLEAGAPAATVAAAVTAAALVTDSQEEVPAEEEASVTEEEVAAPVAPRDEPGEDETPEETYQKFGREIEFIEGIGPVYGERLRAIGITAPLLLLRNGATPKDRQEIAEKSGISEKLILRWVNHVDLFRIKGISQGYAELLETAGVDTVVELAQRNPANLHNHLLEVNEQRNLVRRPPALANVQNWVEQAKQLPRAISY